LLFMALGDHSSKRRDKMSYGFADMKGWTWSVLIGVMGFLLILLFSVIAHAADVTVNWNLVPTATSYTLYYGTDPDNLDQTEDMGAGPSYTFTLAEGYYHLEATASNSYGESGRSVRIQINILPPPNISITISFTIP